jgi:outer membrane protein assembly factor BamB
MNRPWRLAVVALLSFVVPHVPPLCAAEPTKDWPQWRGPNRDAASTEKGLLKEWTEGGPALAWKASGLGRGYGSLVLAGGKIFVMGQRQDAEQVLALEGSHGQELWSAQVGGASGDGPSSTPTIDGDRLYALGSLGDLVCVKVADGHELWRKSLTKDFGGSVPTWKYCESPLIDGNRVVVSPGSATATMVALNKHSGEVIWKTAIPSGGGSGFGYSSAVISEGAGVRQYVQLLGAGTGCVGVHAESGKLLWQYTRVSNGTASIPTPIVDGNHVFCTSGYGTGAALLELSRDGDRVAAREVYFLEGGKLQNHHGGMVKVGSHLFGGHGHGNGFPVCVEMKSGKIKWGGNMRGPGSGSAAVVYADGCLYFRYENGLMALIEASTDQYRLKGQFKIPEVNAPSWSHPVVADGKLYLREQNNLFVYSVR